MDDRLRLIFTCCHPALALEARVALTLRTVVGVPTADIARAFLVSESTMTRRLTRAKTKIADAGIPYRVPSGPALAERLPGVLAVLYLLFTRGYNADGEPAFADEAIRLARLLEQLMPGQSEVAALLALFLFQHSRRDARRDGDGNLLTLERQDRSRWDHAAIAAGLDAPGQDPGGRPVRVAGPDRRLPRHRHGRRRHRLARDRDVVRPTRKDSTLTGHRAEPGGGARLRATGRRPDWRCSPRPVRAVRSTTTRSPSPRRPTSRPATATAPAPPPCSGRPPPSPTASPSAAHCSTAPVTRY